MKTQEKDILAAFNDMMEGKRCPLAPVIYTEAEDDKGGKTQKEEELTMDFEAPKDKADGKDDMDEADDSLKNIDLKSMSNDAKIELISNIIQVLQDSVEDDDEFSDYMNKILEVVDGYKFEKEGEEEEEEEKPEEGGEEEEEAPEAGKEEKPEEE
jgi:hypothetical protein